MFVSAIRRALITAFTAAGILVPAAVFGQGSKDASAAHPEVVSLTIRGVKAVEKSELAQSLATSASKCVSLALKPFCLISKSPIFYKRAYLNRDELARDVVRARVFYWLRGYRETVVDTIVQPAGRKAVKVTLVVHEGEPTIVSGVQLTQAKPVLDDKDIRDRVIVTAGQPLNMFDLDSTRVKLRNRLWDKGYSDAAVDTTVTVDSAAHRAAVQIKIDPRYVTRIKSVDISGNEHVSKRTIRRSLSLKAGDVYRRSTVLESQRSLYESNLFRRASIAVAGRRDSLKTLTVVVQEAPPHAVRLSAGFNTIDFAQVAGRYTDYNWFGGARRLTISTSVGNLFANTLNGRGIFYDVKKTVDSASVPKYFRPTYSASIDVQQPWFGSPRNNLALGVFTHRRSTPGISVDKGYGVSSTFTRTVGIRWPASLNYRFEETTVDASDVYFCVASGVCDQATLNALRKNQRLSPFTLSTSLDRTNDAYEPRSGYRAEFDAEHASSYTLSDFRYNRISNEEAAFLPLGKKSVLAGHVRLGYVNALSSTAAAVGIDSGSSPDILHPRKRFYLGGAHSVRGFAENQLGPRVLTIAPGKLRGTDSLGHPICTAVDISTCDPNAAYVKDRDFDARPLGGNIIAEASVEFRFPVYGDILGAVFVDGGYLAQTTDKTLPRSKTAITPGIGGRYLSPVGPIRVDIGWNPIRSEKLVVITEDTVGGQRKLVTLPNSLKRTYAPGGGFLSHLTLHLSIGEAY